MALFPSDRPETRVRLHSYFHHNMCITETEQIGPIPAVGGSGLDATQHLLIMLGAQQRLRRRRRVVFLSRSTKLRVPMDDFLQLISAITLCDAWQFAAVPYHPSFRESLPREFRQSDRKLKRRRENDPAQRPQSDPRVFRKSVAANGV